MYGIAAAEVLTSEVKQLIELYCLDLAKEITEILVNANLLFSYNTVELCANKEKTGYFIWNDSDLLRLPKTLALPMVLWVRTDYGRAESGGVSFDKCFV